ncbi:MAG: hypothetical protein JWR37_146 [Mycobacterium sp.]|jgi:uncharacterized protein (DUF305 family)|nr:hypothetical protein [Mycobacterium sp.]
MTSVAGRWVAGAVAASAIVVTVSGCGASPSAARDAHHTSAAHVQPSPHNLTDVAFAQNMIPHHRQAVELAAMVPAHSTNQDLIVVAKHISMDQQPEIQILTELLAQWGEPLTMASNSPQGDGDMHMAGIVDDTTMNQLPLLNGASFDELWMRSMIAHHEGAIAMAQTEIARGRDPDAVKLASTIIPVQQWEISRMNHMLSAAV